MLTTVNDVQLLPVNTHVAIVLLNIRSIVPKIDDIHADTVLNNADVLCFCETWLSALQSSPVVKANHVVQRCDRTELKVELCSVYLVTCSLVMRYVSVRMAWNA